MPAVFGGRGGELRVSLEDYEADVLRNLTAEMLALLESEPPASDPVRARLFPDAFEDVAEERAYRDLVGDELRASKVNNTALIRRKLGPEGEVELQLTGDETEAWLALLTDMRLAIGTRLGVNEEMMSAEPDPNHPDVTAISVLHWLGWLQEATLEKVTEEDG
jgi:hypothetical protein